MDSQLVMQSSQNESLGGKTVVNVPAGQPRQQPMALLMDSKEQEMKSRRANLPLPRSEKNCGSTGHIPSSLLHVHPSAAVRSTSLLPPPLHVDLHSTHLLSLIHWNLAMDYYHATMQQSAGPNRLPAAIGTFTPLQRAATRAPTLQDYLQSAGDQNSLKPQPSKRYKCEDCGKSFSRSNTLVTHKRIHTGEKPFTCDTCGRAFRQPGNLTRHKLTHTAVKPYGCNTCGKAFNRASNLNTHMKTHFSYYAATCHVCHRDFPQESDLQLHLCNQQFSGWSSIPAGQPLL